MITVEQLAEICHEANRAYCRAIGDNSQLSWAEAADWQKESAIAGVKFKLENPESGPAEQHEEWLAKKRRDGWRYGPAKDPEKKEF